MIAWLKRRLSLPDPTPPAIVLAIGFYLCHIICSGWVASSESFVAFSLMAFLWALWRKQIKLSSHILFFPLAIYGIDSTVSALAAPAEIHAFGENALWLKMALFAVALILFREVPRSRDLALRTLLIFGAFSATYGLVQYFVFAGGDLEHRITGPTAHVMTLSGLLLPTSLVFLILWIHDRANPWLLAGTARTARRSGAPTPRSRVTSWRPLVKGAPIESVDSMGLGAAEHVRERIGRCVTERAHKATRASSD